jgi:hypothetical protein
MINIDEFENKINKVKKYFDTKNELSFFCYLYLFTIFENFCNTLLEEYINLRIKKIKRPRNFNEFEIKYIIFPNETYNKKQLIKLYKESFNPKQYLNKQTFENAYHFIHFSTESTKRINEMVNSIYKSKKNYLDFTLLDKDYFQTTTQSINNFLNEYSAKVRHPIAHNACNFNNNKNTFDFNNAADKFLTIIKKFYNDFNKKYQLQK